MNRHALIVASVVGLLCIATEAALAQPLPQAAEENKIFQADVGTWDAVMTIWHTGPDGPAIKSQGTEKNRLLSDGTWLITDFRADLGGGVSYNGHGQYGYDAAKKKYVGTWIDSMTSQLTVMEGDYDPKTKTLTLFSEGPDPATGKNERMKYVGRVLQDGSRTFTMYQTSGGDEFVKIMQIDYTRKK